MKWLPCSHCGNEDLDLLHNNLCVIYGEKVANVYCSECGAQAPQNTWNKRKPISRGDRKKLVAGYDFSDQT